MNDEMKIDDDDLVFKITEEDLIFMTAIRKYLYNKHNLLFTISYKNEKKIIEDVYKFVLKSLLKYNDENDDGNNDFPFYYKNMFFNEIICFDYELLRKLYNDYKNIDDVSFISNCFSNSQNPTTTL